MPGSSNSQQQASDDEPEACSSKGHACPTCGRCFGRNTNLQRHIQSAHKTPKPGSSSQRKAHRCSLCGKKQQLSVGLQQFAYMSRLQRHQLFHLSVKEHKCALCAKEFTLCEHLQRHINAAHANRHAHTCPHCQHTFNEQWILERHIRRKHQTQLTCIRCPESFRFETCARWMNHLQYHVGSRACLCTECGRSFRQQSDLHVHRQTHTGGSYLTCVLCAAKCRTHKQLGRHVDDTHTARDGIPCQTCPSKRFYIVDALHAHVFKEHMSAEASETHRLCRFCGFAYPKKQGQKLYADHLAEKHYSKADINNDDLLLQVGQLDRSFDDDQSADSWRQETDGEDDDAMTSQQQQQSDAPTHLTLLIRLSRPLPARSELRLQPYVSEAVVHEHAVLRSELTLADAANAGDTLVLALPLPPQALNQGVITIDYP